MPVKPGLVQGQRFALKDRLAAFTAFRRIMQARRGNTVYREAMAADDVNGCRRL
jgi:hypothetical protein